MWFMSADKRLCVVDPAPPRMAAAIVACGNGYGSVLENRSRATVVTCAIVRNESLWVGASASVLPLLRHAPPSLEPPDTRLKPFLCYSP